MGFLLLGGWVDLIMQMYDYICKKCGQEFEKLLPFSTEDKDVECSSCNNKDSKRLLCAPNISTDADGVSSKSSGNAFLDGGYGGSATITRLSFSSYTIR